MKEYDAIVVGARAAGSPTAMLLARKGYDVLVVDRAEFPSDTMSTHVIHPPGMAALHRWGLADRIVASGCPALPVYRLDLGELVLSGRPRGLPGAPVAYAPRRIILDALLVEASAAAGAEVREGFSVEALIVEDGMVRGISGHTRDGKRVTERARVVIGADGVNSLVARMAGATTYDEVPPSEALYYAYWSSVDAAPEFQLFSHEDRGFALIPTNDGLTIVLVAWPNDQFETNKRDLEGTYLRSIEADPVIADRVRGATRESKLVGTRMSGFYRQAWGSGWAMVGDAGYHKDAVTAQGISDGFRDAEAVAAALDDVFCERATFASALAAYQETRDRLTKPMYELTNQLASFDPPPPEMEELLGALSMSPDGTDDLMSVIAGTMGVEEFFDPENVARYVAAPEGTVIAK